ncbi:MAG TPA: H-NS histone family protein [Hyphomicrobium sp.]|nr:H-NS histone family protein [Hyphomicrobium sp.]
MRQKSKGTLSGNLEKMSLKELVELEARVAKAIAVMRDKERAELKRKMAEMAETHGFSVSELFGGARGRGAGKSKSLGVARYANPDNRSDTWTGRGRKPNWLLERLRKGAKLEDFAI